MTTNDPQYPGPQGGYGGQDRPGPPPPGAQGTGRPGYEPRQGAMSRFFDSLRHCGIVRTQERWVGGVAGGVARRLDVDPTLVRCVWIVVSLFSGAGLVAYGLAWAFLPDESDGQIQVEQALSGRFNAVLAGAIGAGLVGLTMLDNGVVPTWYIDAWGLPGLSGVLWTLFWLGAVALAVVGCLSYSRNRRQGPSQQAQGSPYSPSAQAPAQEAPAWQHSQARPAQQSGPPQAPQPVQAPVPSARPATATARRRGPSQRTSLSVLGLAFLASAGYFLASHLGSTDAVSGLVVLGGVLLVILGAGIVYSALRRRHGGWMSAMGVPALMLALPALAAGAFLQALPTWQDIDERVYTWQDLDSADGQVQELGRHAAGSVLLDLRDMPLDATGTHAVDIEVAAGDLEIFTHPGRSIRINTTSRAGTVSTDLMQQWSATNGGIASQATSTDEHTLDGEPVERFIGEDSSFNRDNTLSSPSAQAAAPEPATLTINAEISAGDLRVSEEPEEITWSGDATEEVWVVSSWTDEDGVERFGQGVSPVPGMEHPAIGTDVASSCLRGTSLEDAEGDNAWEYLDELSAADRERYRACVTREVEAASGSGSASAAPESTPSAEATASPTASPTADGAAPSTSTAPEPSASPTR